MTPRERAVACLVLAALAAGCAAPGAADRDAEAAAEAGALVLDYGPILRDVETRSARFLFHAGPRAGAARPWKAGLEIVPSDDLRAETLLAVPALEVGPETGFVAHLTVEGLRPGTRYTYVPLIDGRRAFAPGPEGLPSFTTPADLGGQNADFTVVFFADQHVPETPETTPLAAYAAAAAARPLFWAQLGDVAAGNLRPGEPETARSPEELARIWRRNYGVRESPQARFAASFPLGLATISDHEIANNYSMNWHRTQGGGPSATLHERVSLYDRAVGTWWDHFGWGAPLEDRLGRVAREDHGESVMAEPPVQLLEDLAGRTACIPATDRTFAPGSFVVVADDGAPAWHTVVAESGPAGSCADGRGATVTLTGSAPRTYRRAGGASIAAGARYAGHGHYRAHRPFPFVEFLLLDTTSYRGDPYQERDQYAREANRDTDHSRHPWNAGTGRRYVFGDRQHGANRTTDGVRSWLGPTQRRAFLDAARDSEARVVVVTAGYPLYSAKFEWSERYWPARESGFDFVTEVEEILAALEGLDKLVLWVHGDGHTPLLVKLRPNVYQLQVGPTLMGHKDAPGHRSRTLTSGDRSTSELIGGGEMIAGHQPELQLGDQVEDFFAGHLEQFEGYLRLYFHPGREALRSSERSGLRRGATDRVVEIPVEQDPARGTAAERVVGRVLRLDFDRESRHSTITAYRFENQRVLLDLADPIVTEDPRSLRVILDGSPWVEARWFDASGREWRDFSRVLRGTVDSRGQASR